MFAEFIEMPINFLIVVGRLADKVTENIVVLGRQTLVKKFNIALALTAITFFGSPLNAGYDCESSVNEYKTAVSEISYTANKYIRCVENSSATDDCSSEFRRLKNAQDDFETAVSDISTYCRS